MEEVLSRYTEMNILKFYGIVSIFNEKEMKDRTLSHTHKINA